MASALAFVTGANYKAVPDIEALSSTHLLLPQAELLVVEQVLPQPDTLLNSRRRGYDADRQADKRACAADSAATNGSASSDAPGASRHEIIKIMEL